MHAGMSYARLEALGGIQWPCYDESHPGELFLHGRLWQEPVVGPRAPFSVVEFEPPGGCAGRKLSLCGSPPDATWSPTTREFRRRRYRSPLRQPEMLGLSPEDGERYGLTEGERVRISSRRGAVEAPVRFDASLRPGLAFLSVHFPDRWRRISSPSMPRTRNPARPSSRPRRFGWRSSARGPGRAPDGKRRQLLLAAHSSGQEDLRGHAP